MVLNEYKQLPCKDTLIISDSHLISVYTSLIFVTQARIRNKSKVYVTLYKEILALKCIKCNIYLVGTKK